MTRSRRAGAQAPHGAHLHRARRRRDHRSGDRAPEGADRIADGGRSKAQVRPRSLGGARAVGEGRTLAASDAAIDPGSSARRGYRDPRPARSPPRRTRARISGNTAASFPASRRRASIGGARRATIIFTCANWNGKPRTRSGSGPIVHHPWRSPRRWCATPSFTARWSVALALAEVLVEGGERVGIPGLMRPTGSRNIIERMAQAIVHDRSERTSLPPNFCALPARRDRAAVRSVERDRRGAAHDHATVRQRRARPCRADRRSRRGDVSVLGPHRIRRAGGRRPHHRRPRRDLAGRLRRARVRATAPRFAARPTGSAGASPSTAPTVRRASFCLRCTARIGAGYGGSAMRWRASGRTGGAGMIGGLPLGFAEPLVLIGLLTLPVLWWLLRLIPPRPRRIDFPPTRLLLEIAPKEETPARTPWWLTLMRLALAGARHHRRGRSALASAAGDDEDARADRHPDR